MVKDLIYANISRDMKFATGYLDYYDDNVLSTIEKINEYKTKSNNDKEKLLEYIKKCRYHFAARIRKTHHFSIPRDIIYMKLLGFINEMIIAYIRKNKNQMIQLEFEFQ